MAADVEGLLALLRRRGLLGGRAIVQELGISQPTLSRLVAKAGDCLLVLGRARAVRYAARSEPGAAVPLYRVGADGRVVPFGTLVPLANDAAVHLREDGESVHAGLPWFVEELRPSGFLGRLHARTTAASLDLPPDPRLWSPAQLLRWLKSAPGTEDLPGDLLIGRAAWERRLQHELEPRLVTRGDYPRLIDEQLSGELPGSSAAGEQPKLACTTRTGALLVKYSPPLQTEAGRRWGELLRCEHLCAVVLRAHGVPTAETRWFEEGGRAFLEVQRFDRTEHGRVAVVSGQLVDAEHVGSGAWLPLIDGLEATRLLSAEDATHARVAHWFGALTGNTDMHLGNIGFFTDDYRTFRLAPLYDMLPMALRPGPQGELPRQPTVPLAPPPPERVEAWSRAARAADELFQRVSHDQVFHDSVRGFMKAQRDRAGQLAAAMHVRL